MTDGTTRGTRAALTAAQKRELDAAKQAAETAAAHYRETAGRIADELGWGGASAVARHLDWTPQHVSTLVAAHKAKAAEGSSAA
ncbi:hypothetical protein [Streptomyces carpinensis]|uniref:Helix-turn-helix DNA binding domain protein n=1 Tax=Streptomyces carpinensis TaxID=66369 RepID=A0ABV1W051_9ACTN|nr:hypothetical protein [Streptomyces carpinensis]